VLSPLGDDTLSVNRTGPDPEPAPLMSATRNSVRAGTSSATETLSLSTAAPGLVTMIRYSNTAVAGVSAST